MVMSKRNLMILYNSFWNYSFTQAIKNLTVVCTCIGYRNRIGHSYASIHFRTKWRCWRYQQSTTRLSNQTIIKRRSFQFQYWLWLCLYNTLLEIHFKISSMLDHSKPLELDMTAKDIFAITLIEMMKFILYGPWIQMH